MPIRSLLEHFEQLPDPRQEHLGLHLLHTSLTIALCAMLCGVEDFDGMHEFAEGKFDWLRAYPNRLDCLKVMRAQAKCSIAR